MQGSEFTVASTHRSAEGRRATLVDARSDAKFRDRVRRPVALIFIVFSGVIALGATLLLARRARWVVPRWVVFALLVLLGFPNPNIAIQPGHVARRYPGDRVGWLGIGSGLNCLMLGLEW